MSGLQSDNNDVVGEWDSEHKLDKQHKIDSRAETCVVETIEVQQDSMDNVRACETDQHTDTGANKTQSSHFDTINSTHAVRELEKQDVSIAVIMLEMSLEIVLSSNLL